MTRKTILLSIALMVAVTIPAQNNVPLSERLNKSNARFETPKLPTIKKTNSIQDWWEPDTLYVYFNNWDGTVGVERNTFEYHPLSQGLLVECTKQWQSDNTWENPYLLCSYSYDSNHNLQTKLQQNRHNNTWVNALLYTYTYDSNNNMLTELWQIRKNDTWESFISYSYTYTYDSNNNMLTEMQQRWDNNSWLNIYLYTYTYDANNNMLTKMLQRWDNNSWANSYFYTYTYDANNNMLTQMLQRWDNNSWANVFLCTYDSNNDALTELWQGWDNDSWVNATKYRRIYDKYGNGILVERLVWTNESWQPSSVGGQTQISLLLYYNNMQSVLEEWGCDKMTASYTKVSDNTTGIASPATPELSAISIYPNPTAGELRIENGELNLSHLPAGMYFVKITTDKGVVTKKIVKK